VIIVTRKITTPLNFYSYDFAASHKARHVDFNRQMPPLNWSHD